MSDQQGQHSQSGVDGTLFSIRVRSELALPFVSKNAFADSLFAILCRLATLLASHMILEHERRLGLDLRVIICVLRMLDANLSPMICTPTCRCGLSHPLDIYAL